VCGRFARELSFFTVKHTVKAAQHTQHTRSRSTVTLGHTFICDIMSLTTDDEIGALIARFKAVKRSEAPW